MEDHCRLFVITLLSQLWEEKNYCESRNKLSSWRPVALPNRHIHLYLFKLGYDVHALLSSVLYILSGENITAVFTISRHRWDQNTTQVANRLDRARAIDTYGCSMFLHGLNCVIVLGLTLQSRAELLIGSAVTWRHIKNLGNHNLRWMQIHKGQNPASKREES